MEQGASLLESEYVQQVYEEIADHFSCTRYKPWPIVERFVNSIPSGCIGLDIGCGNGKNMQIRSRDLHFQGVDCSLELLRICHKLGHSVTQATMLSLPFRTDSQDFFMCIAALHHLASKDRRISAVKEMIRVLRKGGRGLLYVWAFEQPEDSNLYKQRAKLTFLTEDQQDILVPWTLNDQKRTVQRYYHLFRKGELEQLIHEAAGPNISIEYSGYDRDNWYIAICK